MMRGTRTPHEACGTSREGSWRYVAAGIARAFSCVLLAVFFTLTLTPSADAAKKQPSSFGKQSIFGKVNTNIDQSQPMRLQGDQLIYDKAGNRVIARGNVEIYYNDYILTADEVVYDQGAGTLTAVGNVTLKEPQGNIVRADRYTLTDDFRDGFVQSLSVVTQDQSTITADRATRKGGNVNEFENGRFTPCKSDGGTPPLWCISAARIVHDADAATITYQDAYFEIYGQPVFYLPYFQSPDPSVKRKSGFLTPIYGQSSTLGYITGIPYYWAIAPNADLTLTPTYLSDQGLMMQAEWRHRLANGQYTVKLAGIDQNLDDLPDTGLTPAQMEKYDGLRGSVETHGVFSLSSWWKFGWDVTAETDDQFRRFYKLDSVLVTDRVNQVYLTGQSDRNYFNATLYQFQSLLSNSTPQADSYAHPIINYNYVFADPVLGGELKWNTNFLSLSRTDGSPINPFTHEVQNENVTRGITELKWRRRLTDAIGISYTPFANVRGDVYSFDNAVNPTTMEFQTATNEWVGDSRSDSVARGIADGGVTVSYPWVANTAGASHVIEPIGQIVSHQESIPQRGLPNEDAQSLIFDDTNLFATSKFSGYDRIETGTRANVGLQYTFQANDGGYARFLAGQSYQLSGENIYLNPGRDPDGNYIYTPTSGLETNRSDYVLGVYLAPVDEFRIISQSRFDESSADLRREDAAAVFNFGPLSTQMGYSYDANAFIVDPETNQVTITGEPQSEFLGSATLRLTDRWSVGGMTRFDIDTGQLLYDSVQVKYLDECFALTASYIESNYTEDTIEPDRTFMVRLEFKHLGDFAAKTDVTDFNMGGDERVN